jgi:hypothetical protein
MFSALAAVILAAAAVYVLGLVHGFALARFFTIDEWQTGHAAWLVSQGLRPWVDFYEHHMPLGYALSSLALSDDASMTRNALRLRELVFWAMAATGVVLAGSRFVVSRNLHEALLLSFIPFCFGFTLMSVIEHRVDNLAAFLGIQAFAVLDAARALRSRALSATAGVLAAACALVTQKLGFVVGVALAILLLADLWRRRDPAARRAVVFPRHFLAAAGIVFAAALAVAASQGMLVAGWKVAILEAIPHAAVDREVSVMKFARPFLDAARPTTVLTAACFAVWLIRRARREPEWLAPLACAAALLAVARAGYPYNYVFLLLVAAALAVRGFAIVAAWLETRFAPGARPLAPLVYLLPLLILPEQINFVGRAPDNRQQLALLAKIERYSGPGDAVIDGAGGAMFRPHGSYYWMHGAAHRVLLADAFRDQLLRDYRDSRALLWIDDSRQQKLPEPVREFWRDHYVRVDGELYALGFAAPPASEAAGELEVDLLRGGSYHVFPVRRTRHGFDPTLRGRAPRSCALEIDGRPVGTGQVELGEGAHRVAVRPGSPACVVSLLPPEAFRPSSAKYSKLFHYDAPRRRAAVRAGGAGE